MFKARLVNVNETPVPGALAFCDSVIDVPLTIEAIVVLAGMPPPVTDMPTVSPLVEDRPVTELLLAVVLPVNTAPLSATVKVRVTVLSERLPLMAPVPLE